MTYNEHTEQNLIEAKAARAELSKVEGVVVGNIFNPDRGQDEKTALLNRAEQAEATLAETTAELSGLKRHISQMVSAIFGKLFCKC